MSRLQIVAAASFIVACSACSAVLGFEEAIDMKRTDVRGALPDGGASDGGASEGGESGSAPDGATPTGSSAEAGTVTTVPEQDAAPVEEVDCTSACIPEAPPGWSGPLVAYEGSGPPPACTGAYKSKVYDGSSSPIAEPAACECTCDAPSAICSAPALRFYDNPSCTAGCGATEPSGTCMAVPDSCATPYVAFDPGIPGPGTCAPVANHTVPAPVWASSLRLCGATNQRATCEAGKVCAPPASAPFGVGEHCIARAGTWACPTDYPVSRTYHESVSDTRSCTACACGAAEELTCGAPEISGYPGLACGAGAKPVNKVGSSCVRLAGEHSLSYAPTDAMGGRCAPSGGQPVGTLTPTAATTVCCAL